MITKVIKREEIPRNPWVPFVGVHGGFMTGVDAETNLKSVDEIIQGCEEAIRKYRPDGLPVTFDLQIEAEILGCELMWSLDSPPTVATHPLEKGYDDFPFDHIPGEHEGRIPIVLDATKRLREKYDSKELALFGLITGPFTLATHLRGTKLFTDIHEDPESVQRLMAFTTKVAVAMSKYYIQAGVDVVAVVDPVISLISPATFKKFVSSYLTTIFSAVREQGKYSACFVCGNASHILEGIAMCKTDVISVDENVALNRLQEVAEQYGIAFSGNIPLATVLLMGTPEQNKKSAAECLLAGGKTGFILSPGCDLPYNTPVENLKAVADVVLTVPQEKMGEYLAEASKNIFEKDIGCYEAPDYSIMNDVVIDCITLNSESCAACTYMVAAITSIDTEIFKIPFGWKEHRIENVETLRMMKTFNVKQVPSIVIDGVLKFESICPSADELEKAIMEAYEKKL